MMDQGEEGDDSQVDARNRDTKYRFIKAGHLRFSLYKREGSPMELFPAVDDISLSRWHYAEDDLQNQRFQEIGL